MSKPFTPSVIVGAVVAGEAAAVKGQLEALINSVDKSTLDIGQLLYTVKLKSFYAGWGFSTFKEYTNTLKIKPRKAQYLTRIVGVMDEVGIKREVYEPLGIARLREITSLDPKEVWTNPDSGLQTPIVEFIKGFVNDARKDDGDYLDVDTIKQHVRTLKGFVGENDLVFETLCMTRSARENSWLPAIELAKAHIGSVGKDDEGMSKDASTGAAAEKLAIAYLVDPQNELDAFDTTGHEEGEEENDEQTDIQDAG